LSRSRLERIINDLDLYKSQRAKDLIMEDAVRLMRSEITVTVEGKEAFRVSYDGADPRTAQKVAERLASLFIEENLRDRENLAENTNQFLQSQLEDARRRLLDHEKKLQEYRQRYAGQLPTQLQGNLQAIQNAQLQLQSLDESNNRSRERRLLIERQLADAQTLPIPISPAESVTTPSDPALSMTTAQQLDAAQTRLKLLKMHYTADHPDVRTLERTITDLQAKLQEEAKTPATPPTKPVTPAEIARQKRVRDLRAELEVIDHQLASNEAEASRLKATAGSYQAKVDALPSRESELVELTRDYSTLQQTYTTLLAKYEDSKVAANLERRQIGEQFKVLDSASLPQRPYNLKKRLTALAGGVAGGIALGLGLVGFLEYRDTTFKREEDVLRVLTLPVLALVPSITTEEERDADRRRHRKWVAALTAVLLVVASATALLVWRIGV
jgi:polysaccharide chain length determinant protein (PEP-CTERM system associated)